jgi:ketosteroid isomerase-like protein
MATTKTKTPDLSIETTDGPGVMGMRRSFDAFAKGDLDTVRANFTTGVVWTNLGDNPLSGEHRGWEQVERMFGKLFELTDGTFAMNVLSIVGDARHAVAIYDETATIKGVTETHRACMVAELTPEGLTRSVRLLPYDQAANDAQFTR